MRAHLAGLPALIVLAACGGKGPPTFVDAPPAADANNIDAAPPRDTVTSNQPLQVGELVEAIMHGGPSDLGLIHLEAPAGSLSWNLHSHLDGGTQVVYEQLNQTTVDYAFTPPAQGDWYILLRNDGQTDITVKVKVGLYGAMTWEWQ